MQQLSFPLTTAVAALAAVVSFAPAQATSVHIPSGISTGGQNPAGIHEVRDRWDRGGGYGWRGGRRGWHDGWRRGSRRHFGHRYGLGLGFATPFVGYPHIYDNYPRAYRAYPVCPYGYGFDGYACVPVHYPAYRYVGPGGLPLDYRERGSD